MLATLLRTKNAAPATERTELFDSLMRDTQRQAFSFAMRLCGTSSDAEDLVQETYLRAYRFFHRYDESMPFSSWIYRIMTNLHIDGLRRKGRLRTTSLDVSGPDGSAWDVPDEDSSPDRFLIHDSLNDTIQAGLLAMNGEFRAAVLLADVEGMAYEEIAEVMQCSIGTVRSRIHRGRKQLRSYLERVNYRPEVELA